MRIAEAIVAALSFRRRGLPAGGATLRGLAGNSREGVLGNSIALDGAQGRTVAHPKQIKLIQRLNSTLDVLFVPFQCTEVDGSARMAGVGEQNLRCRPFIIGPPD